MGKTILLTLMTNIIISTFGHDVSVKEQSDSFNYVSEQFADIKILRFQVPGFETLHLNQKKLVYYLSQAALAGRDIIFDQNGKYGLSIRRTLETVVETYKGDR